MASYQRMFYDADKERRQLMEQLEGLKATSEKWRLFILENYQTEFLRWEGQRAGLTKEVLDEVFEDA